MKQPDENPAPVMPLQTPADIDACNRQARERYAVRCEDTLALALQAVAAAARIGYAGGEAEAWLLAGKSQQVLGLSDEGLASIRKALKLAQGYPNLQAEAYLVNGLCLLAQGQPHQALQQWLDALGTAVDASHHSLFIEVLLGIGNIFVQYKNHSQAFHYHIMAVEWAELVGSQDLTCRAHLHLAADLIALKDFALALKVLEMDRSELILPLRRDWLAEIDNYLGMVYANQQAWDRAEFHFRSAYNINRECTFLWGQCVNLLELGKLKLALEDNGAAERFLLEALKLADNFKGYSLLQQIHEQLYQLYEVRGDYIRAVMHHIGYHEHCMLLMRQKSSSNLSAVSSRRINQAEMKLRLLGSEIEISQLRAQRSLEHERMLALETAAYRDSLTNTYNRRALDERLPDLIEEAQRQNEPLSLLMFDFDHFKQINDDFSHRIGDQVLQQSVLLLTGMIRESDLLARYGGEEFTLVLPGVSLDLAGRIAERMRLSIANFEWAGFAAGLAVTVSIGAAAWEGEDPLTLLSKADRALYRAKEGGRNRVELAREAP